ncbi:DUF6011 domain-containing protein [Streptomyces sp. NPDC090026]|uniref:DUF6011 domain-containing protein n=1 Tax=Streptomyces sp. NPDC090026 TaxID=3365923 RepID=UPI0038183D75
MDRVAALMADTCDDCGRPLRDPASRAAGRGPVCAAKYRPGRRAPGRDQLPFEETLMPLTTRTFSVEKLAELGVPYDCATPATTAQFPRAAVELHRERVEAPRWISVYGLVFRAPDDGKTYRVRYQADEQGDTGPWEYVETVTAFLVEPVGEGGTEWVAVIEQETPVDHPEPAPSRARCGNDPRARLTPGDKAAVDDFKAYLAEQEGQAAPVDWQAIAKQRERELKAVGEAQHRAEAALARVRAVAEELIRHGCPWSGNVPGAAEQVLAAMKDEPGPTNPAVAP